MLFKPQLNKTSYRIILVFPVIVILAVWVVWSSLAKVQDVTDHANKLVASHMPKLREIAALRDVLNSRVLILHEYYATTNPPDLEKIGMTREDCLQHLKILESLGLKRGEEQILDGHFSAFQQAAMSFHTEMQRGVDRDWDELRRLLAEATHFASLANVELTSWNETIRKDASEGGEMTLKEISLLNTIQLTFGLAMVLVAGLLLIFLYARIRDQTKLFHNANFDPLTDLPNRRSLQFHADDNQMPGSRDVQRLVLLISLDRIALICGTFGHLLGDRLVARFSEELAKRLEQNPLTVQLYSFNSTTWVLIIEETEGGAEGQLIIDAFEAFTHTPFAMEGREFNVACSIGIARSPEHGDNLELLLRNADTARRATQEAGGNNYLFYEQSMTADAEQMLSMENDLRNALRQDAFELYYQPKMSARGDETCSAEALLRWRCNGEYISPGLFIPVAEKTGLIIAIGDWVLRRACNQWVEWQKAGFSAPPIAVNISVQQFQMVDFPETVKRILQEAGMPPHMLELEVTEEASSGRPDRVVDVMTRLKAIGVTLAIDDFGTGYSSLAYLKRFPIDVLKIDRAFICQIGVSNQDQAIARMIMGMAHQFGFKVVAEGVETAEQWRILLSMKCDLLQGYYFSKPLPAADYQQFVAQGNSRG